MIYEKPEIELILFPIKNDIVTTSLKTEESGDNYGWKDGSEL